MSVVKEYFQPYTSACHSRYESRVVNPIGYYGVKLRAALPNVNIKQYVYTAWP
jgi:hypothetical protein